MQGPRRALGRGTDCERAAVAHLGTGSPPCRLLRRSRLSCSQVRKLPHTRVNCAKSSIRNFGCRWILAEEDTPGRCRMQDAQCNHWASACIEQNSGGLACTFRGPTISTCVAHSTLSMLEPDTARVSPPARTYTSTAAPLRT